jgi:hypothetical protein
MTIAGGWLFEDKFADNLSDVGEELAFLCKHFPRFTMKVSEANVFGGYSWVPDPDFKVERHYHRHTLVRKNSGKKRKRENSRGMLISSLLPSFIGFYFQTFPSLRQETRSSSPVEFRSSCPVS